MPRALGKNKTQSLELLTVSDHCPFPQLGKPVADFMPRISHSDDFSVLCFASEWPRRLPRNSSSPYFQGETQALSLPPRSTRSPESCSLRGHQKPPSHVQRLAASVFSRCVSRARNGLKPSGQQQKQRSRTSFHANDLSVASCSLTALLSARALGPSKPGARF